MNSRAIWRFNTAPNRDDFFPKYDERFRTYSSERKDKIQQELLEDDEIRKEWKEYQQGMERRADYFNKSPEYELQSPKVAGRTVASENDLSALFLERVFDISSINSHVSLILPGFVFSGAIAKDLRRHLLDYTQVNTIVGFENKGIFEDIDDRYRFGIFTFRNGGNTDVVRGIFSQRTTKILRQLDQRAVNIPKQVLAEYSPEAGIFPSVTSQREVNVLKKILSQPSLGEELEGPAWNVSVLTKELHEPSDSHLFVESEEEGEYPVYGGENFHQFIYNNQFYPDLSEPQYWSCDYDTPEKSAKHRIREKKFNQGYLKKAIYKEFGGAQTRKSQVQFVDDLLEEHRDRPLQEEDVLLDCTEYRIAYRDVTNSTNERTVIAAILPQDVTCLHTVQTIKPYSLNPAEADLSEFPLHNVYEREFTDPELFAALGMLNGIPFDFLLRTKVETHIVKYKFLESQLPRFTDGDDWFHYISERAARLNCYGEEFAEMRDRLGGIEPATNEKERRRLQAEIDAAAFHAYGLDREDTKFVLDDFHRVEDPRLMDGPYFNIVLEKYDELAEEGPKP